MAYIPLFGTGFEQGSIEMKTGSGGTVTAATDRAKTGTYALKAAGGFSYANATFGSSLGINEIYFTCWANFGGWFTAHAGDIRFNLSDGTSIGLTRSGSGTLDFYRNGSLVSSGSIPKAQDTWFNIQIRLLIHDTTGIFQTKLDGVSDINFTGDTKPSTGTTVSSVSLGSFLASSAVWYDNVSFGTSDWPGDLRFELLYPTGDIINQWSSTGANAWSVVDERPPNTSDYIYVSSGIQDSIVDLSTVNISGQNVQFVVGWAYAKKDTADSSQLSIVFSGNGAISVGDYQNITTDYTYISRIATLPPGSGLWTQAEVDALCVGVRSNII